MRARWLTLASAALAAGVLAGAAPAASGQAAIARTADGHPDLQGTYDLGTLTPVERRPGMPLVLTSEQAAALEQQVAQQNAKGYAPIAGDRAAPPAGGD